MPDYAIGTTFSFKFTTKKNGVATSLSGGTVVAYVGNSTTEITAGITLTADFDGVTGLNDVTVVATSGNGYTASDISFVLTAGTLGGTNAFPATVGEFTLERESAQMADKVLGRNLAGSSDGGRTVKDALRALRNKVVIDETTVTVYQEDDTTTAWSGTATRTDVDALTTVDPS